MLTLDFSSSDWLRNLSYSPEKAFEFDLVYKIAVRCISIKKKIKQFDRLDTQIT